MRTLRLRNNAVTRSAASPVASSTDALVAELLRDGRDALGASAPRRERDRDHRSGRESRESRDPRDQHRGFRPAAISRDPFFEKPYEASAAADAAPAWEAATKAAPRSSISANIKPKRKVAALFKAAAQPETSAQ